MAHDGQVLDGPDGMKLELLQTGGEELVMEASYSGRGGLPPAHLHPRQTERFTVLDGAMRTIIGGEERRHEAGAVFEVPPGTVHQMAPDGGPARVRWEVRPALRTAEFFERLFGDGPGSAAAAVSIADFLGEFSEEIRFSVD